MLKKHNKSPKDYATKILNDTSGNVTLAKSILSGKAQLAHNKGIMHEERFEFMTKAFQEIEVEDIRIASDNKG